MDTSLNGSLSEQCEYAFTDVMLYIWLFLYLLLIPLFISVVYVAYNQRKKQQSFSHSDVFTFNIVGMEILAIVGNCMYVIGDRFSVNIEMGGHLLSTGTTGQMCFHSLTCVERYLAVVHPIAYLHLKKRGGVMIRNGAIAGAWVLSVGLAILNQVIQKQDDGIGKIFILSLALFFFVVVTFCSISVLCVLIRPGPGEGGGHLRRIDQSKQRVFLMLMLILGVLMLRFVVDCTAYLMGMADMSDTYGACLMSLMASVLEFPSSLVLPLMFLQKYGKLPKW